MEIGLDGILFDDLSFFGPNRLNSRRSMTVWELEAMRDRQYFKEVLQSRGRDGLRAEMLASLNRQADRYAYGCAGHRGTRDGNVFGRQVSTCVHESAQCTDRAGDRDSLRVSQR